MKKFIMILSVLLTFATSSFAINFAVGGRALFGGNLSPDNSEYQGFVCGGGAFFNLDLIMGLGFQGEVNLLTNRVTFAQNSISFQNYETVDVPFYIWYNLPIRPISIGGGVGLNFSGHTEGSESSGIIVGFAAGANLIAYVAKHFGLVFAAHYVWDVLPQVSNTVKGDTSTYTFTVPGNQRHSISGSVGLEYKF